jgi:hypothetical protein
MILKPAINSIITIPLVIHFGRDFSIHEFTYYAQTSSIRFSNAVNNSMPFPVAFLFPCADSLTIDPGKRLLC